MATFESRIHALRIEPHPNADRLELAAVGGFRCIVGKGSFADGDLAACIPEGAVCPDWLIAELGLEGRLAGKRQNRVKAVKLRGCSPRVSSIPCATAPSGAGRRPRVTT